MSPGAFSLSQVRAAAEQFGYSEIGWNETSRLISFRKDSVRINVYYTTRTVGTCLNHPVRGKTQLFRREVPMDQLQQIFENPRSHTGKGYYHQQNLSQQWKGPDGMFASDMARRWLYVCSAAELTNNTTDLDVLKRLMNKITEILWEPGEFPDLEKTRFYCGSRSAVVSVALQVAQQDGAAGHVDWNAGAEEITLHEDPPCARCSYFAVFEEDDNNRTALELVKNLLMQLPPRLRMRICDWLIGLIKCGHGLLTEDGLFVDKVHDEAHQDYSTLAYPKKDLHKMCKLHGIIYAEYSSEFALPRCTTP